MWLWMTFIVVGQQVLVVESLQRHGSCRKISLAPTSIVTLRAVDDGDNNKEDNYKSLSSLGYSEQEIQRSRSTRVNNDNNKDDVNVNVNLLPDVDAVTLTAVGFGLIAANFFIFANMGDGGIAGMIASIINLSRQ